MQVKKFLLSWFCLIAGGIFFSACDADTPAIYINPNTDEYKVAHGISNHLVNEIRIVGEENIPVMGSQKTKNLFPSGGVLFRFPAGMGLEPFTAQNITEQLSGPAMKKAIEQKTIKIISRPIVPGQADKISFVLMGEQSFKPAPSPRYDVAGTAVRVTIGLKLGDEIEHNSRYLTLNDLKRKANFIQYDSHLEMTKYVLMSRAPHWSPVLYYVSDAQSISNQNPILIRCKAEYNYKNPGQHLTKNAEPGGCTVSYRLANGVSVRYQFGAYQHLSNWQGMHRAVEQFIHSAMIQK